jgi:hypothetical protein
MNPTELDGESTATMPDIVLRVKYAQESSRFFTLAGIVRQTRFDDGSGAADRGATGHNRAIGEAPDKPPCLETGLTSLFSSAAQPVPSSLRIA